MASVKIPSRLYHKALIQIHVCAGENSYVVFRLDYISCLLTIVSTLLVGKKLWYGWLVAGVNSVIICLIGMHTGQFGFIPANLFCLALYGWNLRKWTRA
jgi:hypothetical protein